MLRTKYDYYDPDSSSWTWNNFYYPVYSQYSYWAQKFPANLSERNKALYYSDGNILIRGDTVFNFMRSNGKYYVNNNILSEDELKQFQKFHHSILNFSLFPSNGMQQAKCAGRRGDRLDVFLYEVDQIISNNQWHNSSIKNYCQRYSNGATLESIKSFFMSFADINSFFRAFYFPTEDIVLSQHVDSLLEKFLDNGRRYSNWRTDITWDNVCNRKSYLKIAIDFWILRKHFLEDVLSINVEEFDDGLDIENYFHL